MIRQSDAHHIFIQRIPMSGNIFLYWDRPHAESYYLLFPCRPYTCLLGQVPDTDIYKDIDAYDVVRLNWPDSESQNAPVPYPRMLHSEQKCAHFCSEWSIQGYGTGAFWDLWNWSIVIECNPWWVLSLFGMYVCKNLFVSFIIPEHWDVTGIWKSSSSKARGHLSHTTTIKSLIGGAPNPKTYVSRLVLQLSFPNPLKTGVKSRMKM